MDRPSRFVHPFRSVRNIMGMSQQKAAEALGISRSTLQQIERGVLPLSMEIHLRMRALSGANIPEGLCTETIPPVERDYVTPYDAKSLERWRKDFPHQRERILRFINLELPLFVEVAERKGYLLPFLWAVRRAILRLADDFKIQEEADRLFKERTAPPDHSLKPKKSSESKKPRP
jgi:DNA-binding XRE family transcriptional regulator